jgi:hypothetical protein
LRLRLGLMNRLGIMRQRPRLPWLRHGIAGRHHGLAWIGHGIPRGHYWLAWVALGVAWLRIALLWIPLWRVALRRHVAGWITGHHAWLGVTWRKSLRRIALRRGITLRRRIASLMRGVARRHHARHGHVSRRQPGMAGLRIRNLRV